jgi:hypothetical protein
MPRNIHVRGVPREEIDTEAYAMSIYLMAKRRVEDRRRLKEKDKEQRTRREASRED